MVQNSFFFIESSSIIFSCPSSQSRVTEYFAHYDYSFAGNVTYDIQIEYFIGTYILLQKKHTYLPLNPFDTLRIKLVGWFGVRMRAGGALIPGFFSIHVPLVIL